jgi:hypothetical protein
VGSKDGRMRVQGHPGNKVSEGILQKKIIITKTSWGW